MIIHTHSSGFNHGIPSEITPEAVYHSRRDLIRQLATGSAGLALAAWGVREAHAQSANAAFRPLSANRLATIGKKDALTRD